MSHVACLSGGHTGCGVILFSGSVSVGNLPRLLPFVLREIDTQPKRQYLLLHSLKEVVMFACSPLSSFSVWVGVGGAVELDGGGMCSCGVFFKSNTGKVVSTFSDSLYSSFHRTSAHADSWLCFIINPLFAFSRLALLKFFVAARHHCSNSSNIPRSWGWPIRLNIVAVWCSLEKSTYTKGGSVGAKNIFQGACLFSPNHSFTTCGGPDVLTSTTIFQKCGGQICSGRPDRQILRGHLELPTSI